MHWLRRLVFRSAWLDQRVKEGELDVVFEEAERTRSGFGSVKLAREPLRRCAFSVEQAFRDASRCVNRRFSDYSDAGADAIRAFDLRDRLTS